MKQEFMLLGEYEVTPPPDKKGLRRIEFFIKEALEICEDEGYVLKCVVPQGGKLYIYVEEEAS